jgi:urease accessory protein
MLTSIRTAIRAGPRRVTTNTSPERLSLLRLLQLSSPSLPVGAYAYSQGLEQAAELGWVRDASSLEAWVRGVLRHSLAATDLALLLHAYRAFQSGDDAEALALSRLAIALRETSELRAEERQLGASLARTLSALGVQRVRDFLGDRTASWVVLFALAGVHFGIPPGDLAHGYAFAWLENQVLGATRVISLGQSDAQRVLLSAAESIVGAVELARSLSRDEIGRSLPGHCLSSARHEQQYSRLFRS